MNAKRILFPVISVASGLIAGACIIAVAIVIYVKWAQVSRQDTMALVRNSEIARQIFTDKSFKRLMAAVGVPDDKFSTVWDFDDGVALSKRLFLQTEMFGLDKYRYRPNVGIYNCRIWSGLDFRNLEIEATSEIKELLKKVDADCSSTFETDDNGFKKTEFSINTGSPNIFFLGDSFTEGLWVAPEFTFVNLFGQKLKSHGISATPINLGVNGYSALEMCWMLEHFGPLFTPIAVVVNLFPNDVHVDYNQVIMGRDIPEKNYTEMFNFLQRIQIYSDKHDVKLIIAVIPPKRQLTDLRNFSVFQDRVRAWADGRNITFLDPRAYFERIGGVDEVYLSWDPHFSIKGHQHYANFLIDNAASIISEAITHVKSKSGFQ